MEEDLQQAAAPVSATQAELEQADVVERLVVLLCELMPELGRGDEEKLAALREVVRREFAGEQLYVTRRRPVIQTRAEVLRRFNGRNATEVARQLRISRATVYRLLKQSGS